ncbi:SMI1/KNR4 family protein [Polyangium jinanense]|uniref:SMI1/KNR4 family protein n=1 Tax=Polyangium jinanense TaxID=2829994 RepID=A0A9X4AQI1_9BACT|nr:SMI1/KNR4 family protein [Polyangium jinanense]MDC3952757.1 SMI1/KNR4 family protein [Polyangium jinanense]MDC3980376.1 SMI1/KNR4 family protein [Polyangium jinanense]
MSDAWLDPTLVRSRLNGPGENALRKAFKPDNEAHAATLLALDDAERIGLLERSDAFGSFRRALNQLSHACAKTRPRDALVIFDALLQGKNPDLATYCNALWAVQDDNTHLGKDPERARKYLAACLPHGPKNPAIFYNAACVAIELDDLDAALGYVEDAVRFGYGGREAMRTAFRTEALFAKIRDDRRFFDALDDRGPQGVALVERVIAKVREEGFSALGVEVSKKKKRAWPKHDKDFRPLSPEVLDALTLPNGAPLPPSLRRWLAFDAQWLSTLGWFELAPAFRWTPRSLEAIAKAEFGDMDEPPSDPEPGEVEEGEQSWASFFDVPAMEYGFLVPGGAEHRRVWMLSNAPDREGDYPVLYMDIDDVPSLGPMYPGFDVWLAQEANVIRISYETYSSAFEDFRFASRLRHHARTMCDGAEYVQCPSVALRPPHPDDGVRVSLDRDDWFERLLALRASHLPADDAPIRGASAEDLTWLQEHLGAPLPPAVVRFYERVNGLSWGPFRFLSIDEIRDRAAQRSMFGEATPPASPFAVLLVSPGTADGFLLLSEEGMVDGYQFADEDLSLTSPKSALEEGIESVRHAALFAGEDEEEVDEDEDED